MSWVTGEGGGPGRADPWLEGRGMSLRWQGKSLPSGKAPGVDQIRSEMLKALDVVRLSWRTCLFKIAWRSGSTPVQWQTGVMVPMFKKGDLKCVSSTEGSNYSASQGKFTPGCWRGS